SAASETVVIPPDGVGTPSLSPNPSHDGAYTVSWSSASRATYYRLDEKAGQGWGQVYSGSAHQWSASGKADGTYKYKVRPCNDGGCASWSGTATETVSPPPQPPNPPPVPPNPPCPHQPCRQPKLDPAGGASALTVTYTYDAYGNLAKVKNAADGTVYWQADTGASVPAVSPWGTAQAWTLGNGIHVKRRQDPRTGAITTITAGPGENSAARVSLAYGYDARGNASEAYDVLTGVGYKAGTTTYDGLNRL